MDAHYHVLLVTDSENGMVIQLPLTKCAGKDLHQRMTEDFQHVIRHASRPVTLDLSQVKFIDAWFFTRLIELRKGLTEKSIGLTVHLSPGVADVAKTTKLDRIFDIVIAD